MRNIKRVTRFGLAAAAMAFSMMLFSPFQAKAAYTVQHTDGCEPGGAYELRHKDKDAIKEALKEYKDIKLEDGKTYYIAGPIDAVDGGSIDAGTATIICEKVIVHNNEKETDSIANFSINGGTWKKSPSAQVDGSSFRFHFGNNLKFTNMVIEHANMENHAIELVACKNVLIEHCTITGQGSAGKKSVEEQIQIDIAAPSTAPFLKKAGKTNLLNGQGCVNITINDCTVIGGRAICANLPTPTKYKKYHNSYHKNITVTNCTLTGTTSEGLMIFNTKGATITDNVIISNASKSQDKYKAFGLHVQIYGNAKSGLKYTIKNNTIKGRSGSAVISANTSKTKFNKVTFTGNKCYSKAGNSYHIDSYKKLKDKGNKSEKW